MESDKRAGVIYGLYEPGILLPFYVGFTTQEKWQHRLAEHICGSKRGDRKNVHKERLIAKMLASGSRPEIKLLEEVSGSIIALKEREIFWIAELKPRTNSSPGGDWNPMLSDKREQAIAKLKAAAARKRKDAANALGITEEELVKSRQEAYNLNSAKWARERPEVCRKYSKANREKLRLELGEAEYKKKIAEKRRSWYANISPEQKEEQRRKEREYRQRKRDERKLQANAMTKINVGSLYACDTAEPHGYVAYKVCRENGKWNVISGAETKNGLAYELVICNRPLLVLEILARTGFGGQVSPNNWAVCLYHETYVLIPRRFFELPFLECVTCYTEMKANANIPSISRL